VSKSSRASLADQVSATTAEGLAVDCEEWDAFVDQSHGSIYCKSWWLDAVCPGAYQLIAVRKDGVIRAGMALPVTHDRGRSIVRMPPLTQTLGPLPFRSPTSRSTETVRRAGCDRLPPRAGSYSRGGLPCCWCF